MHDYPDRFRAMVAELVRHPRVRVTHAWFGPGATEEELADVERRLGQPLAAPIRAFYRQVNGLQLRWIDTTNPRYVPGRDDVFTSERKGYLCGDGGEADGLVDLLPLRLAFEPRDLPELEPETDLYLFDQYSFYGSTALALRQSGGDPRVVFGDDHDATFSDSNVTDFTSYLEFVLQHRGHVEARSETFFSRDPKPVVIEPGPAVRIETLLSDRATVDHGQAIGKRVFFRCTAFSDVVRGTVVGVQFAPTPDSSWPYGPELCRVRLDLGVEVWVARSNATRVTQVDAYEQAIADPARFFARTLAGSPTERFRVLAEIASRRGATGRNVESALRIRDGAWRFLACVLPLPAPDRLAVVLTLIDGFTVDKALFREQWRPPATRFDPTGPPGPELLFVAHLVSQLLSAAALVVAKELERQPFERLASRFGAQNADRLSGLLDRYAELTPNPLRPLPPPDPTTSTEFLRRSLHSDPGRVVAPFTSSGARFGVEDLPVVW